MSSLFIARKNSEKNGPSTTYPAVLVLLFLDYVVKTRTSSSTSCTLNAKDKEMGKLSLSPRTPAILDGSIQEKKNFYSIISAWGFLWLFSLLSHVWPFATPWTAAHQASLSSTISWSLLRFMPIESLMPSDHLILSCPLLLLPSIFPSSGGEELKFTSYMWPIQKSKITYCVSVTEPVLC